VNEARFGYDRGVFEKLGHLAQPPLLLRPDPYFDFQDSVSYLRGKHTFQLGGEFAPIEVDEASYDNGRGARLPGQSNLSNLQILSVGRLRRWK
jgi:hypothetical protein